MSFRRRDMLSSLDMSWQNFTEYPADNNAFFRKPAVQLKDISPSSPTVISSPADLVHVLGYTPGEGEQGVPITANINFTCQVSPVVRVRLVVGRRAIATQVRELSDQTYGRWQLEGIIPPFSKQRTMSQTVPLTVQAVNLENIVLDSVTFGEFTYWESQCSTLPIIGSKRRREEVDCGDVKPASPQQLPSPPPTAGCDARFNRRGPRNRPKKHRRSNLASTRDRLDVDPPGKDDHKAILQLLSPLEILAQHWDDKELRVGRRLVRFRKVQEGHKLKVTCDAISQEDYLGDDDIVISCIRREGGSGYCVTSVDIIYLLEKLVDESFEVEEKNRIRRNLEGLRPKTISKHKPGSEDFFQRIMDFPNPKPRNIEKDVKVFDWDLLPQALDKIITKYTICHPSEDIKAGIADLCPCIVPDAKFHLDDAVEQKQDPSIPTTGDEPQLSCPSDTIYPAMYVDPAVFLSVGYCDTTMLSTTNSSALISLLTDSFDGQSEGTRSSSASWDPNMVKLEVLDESISPISPISPFDLPQFHEPYRVDFGVHLYDSLEFQALSEQHMERNFSEHSIL